MRRFRVALAVCALVAAPAALLAQQTQQQQTPQHQPPNVRTIPPVTRPGHPRPGASGAYAQHNHGRSANPYANSYPIVINGAAMNRLLATPSPKPKRTPAAHRLPNGEQVFETHSTDDAR